MIALLRETFPTILEVTEVIIRYANHPFIFPFVLDISDSEQRREFLEEIQLMKAVGSHKNIVNMVGCCTVEEPMFLLTEYVPYGDLLRYLRKRRGKVNIYACTYGLPNRVNNC